MRASDEKASLVGGGGVVGGGNTSPASVSITIDKKNGGKTNVSSNGGGGISSTIASVVTCVPEFQEIFFYRSSQYQSFFFLFLSIGTCGFLPLMTMWFPKYYTLLNRRQVQTIEEAEYILVKYEYLPNQFQWEECRLNVIEDTKYFEFRKARHFWDPRKNFFLRIKNELQERTIDIEKRIKTGLAETRVNELFAVYGPNEIDLKPKTWQKVLLRKVLHPFYLFQVASALIWLCEKYTTYALIIVVMSAISIIWEVYTQVSSDQKLHELVKMDISVKVVRDQRVQSISVNNLVVGDIVVIEEGMVPADMVLIAGEATADESTLTGEAIPITKQCLHTSKESKIDTQIKSKVKEAVVYAGSTLVAVKPDGSTRGVVLCTGFCTSKGELFRSIVFPKPISFKIERDSYRFLAGLGLIAILAFIKRLVQASTMNIPANEALISSLDLVTIAVPPALPLVLTVGVGFAMKRLEKANIFCINSQRVNLAGHVDCFCFDKTGTLSSDHLDFQGVDEVTPGTNSFIGLQSEVDVLSQNAMVGLATCHGLNEKNGNITGYALELDMFRATGFSMETNTHKPSNSTFSVLINNPIGKTFGVVKRFLFDASLQRSSVLIEDFESGQRVVYTKGSPEAIMGVCNPASLPVNYMEKVRTYSYQGYYVVALASKGYPVTADIPVREAMECRLNFVGFILFLNKIKTESPFVISSLEEAQVDVRMITGDNAFTAIHVSRKINMELNPTILLIDKVNDQLVYADVDDLASTSNPQWIPLDTRNFLTQCDANEFSMTGAALDILMEMDASESVFVDKMVYHTKIFSRIRPHQKSWIIEQLIRMGKCVGMVGDGTNDCGALKAAHVGVALSDADASIVAPFTSRKKQITDVLDLLKEGRCALSTSFCAFKYMVLYSIIQVSMCSIMMDYQSEMSNNQFLFDDLVVVFGISLLMVRTASSNVLTREIPTKSLFAPAILVSLGGQIILMLCCLGIAISSLTAKDWYCSAEDSYKYMKNGTKDVPPPCYTFLPGSPEDLTQHSYENTVIWLYGHMSYWIVGVAFNIKDTFRRPFYTNKTFCVYMIFLFIVLAAFLFNYDNGKVDENFGMTEVPNGFYTSMFFLFLFQIGVSVVWEIFVVGFLLTKFQAFFGKEAHKYGLLSTGGMSNVTPEGDGLLSDKKPMVGASVSILPGSTAPKLRGPEIV